MGEALQGLRDALLSAVAGAEVSAMVSAISRGHLPWPTPTTAPIHGRSCFGPRRAGAAALVVLRVGGHPISAWEIASSDLSVGDRDAGAVPAGRFFRARTISVHDHLMREAIKEADVGRHQWPSRIPDHMVPTFRMHAMWHRASRRRGHHAVVGITPSSAERAIEPGRRSGRRSVAQSACWDVCAVPHVVFYNTSVA